MEYQRAEAIVLRRQPVTESSLIVTWFTREFGKLKTLAKGARRSKGPFVGKIDLFYEDEIVWLTSRRSDLHLLHDCFLVHPHPQLRVSVTAMTAAAYACELVELGTEVEDAHPRVYELLAALLGTLEEKVSGTVLVWFELQVLAALGWTPKWETGTVTGKLLASLAGATPAGARRVRLSAAQLRDARDALWLFSDAQLGRSPRSRKLLLETMP